MQCEIAAAYMSGNLRHTKQLISELTVPTTGHPLRPDALAVEASVPSYPKGGSMMLLLVLPLNG